MNKSQISRPAGSDMNLCCSAFGSRRCSGISVVNATLLLIGSSLHLLAEASLLPSITAALYFCVGWFLLWCSKLGGSWERHIYARVFMSGFLSAGIAAAYRAFFGDNQVDASAFFEMVSGAESGLSIVDIAALTEGSLAVVLWRGAYDSMAAFGFSFEQYIGVLVNVLIVALSSVFSLRIVRKIYGHDACRFNILVLMYSSCGLFWIYSGIFVRDSIILLVVNIMSCVWVSLLTKPNDVRRVVMVVISSILASTAFEFLRREFVFVPMAMAAAAIAAIYFAPNSSMKKTKTNILIAFGVVVVGVAYVCYGEALHSALSQGRDSYIEEAATMSNDGSLGMTLIVNQPTPIRLILGSVYLFLFPIPLWSGFQLESSYNLFKSLNLIFMCFLLPSLLLGFSTIMKYKTSRSPVLMFMLFLVIGFTLAIAGTSMETRHLGVFYGSIFMLALLPNMRSAVVRAKYRQLLLAVVFGIISIHCVWFIMKLT